MFSDISSSSETMPGSRTSSRRLHKFDPIVFEWDEWIILFDAYLAVENISHETEKQYLLMSSLSEKPLRTLNHICKPSKPNAFSYQNLLDILRSHYVRDSVSVPTERVKFFAKRQTTYQTITMFANDLRAKALMCGFPPSFHEQALITAFVGGLKNEEVRNHLMQQELKTFEATLNAARIMETVITEEPRLKRNSSQASSVREINVVKSKCDSCGSMDHLRSHCCYRQATCHRCNKRGHLAKVCRSYRIAEQTMIDHRTSPMTGPITKNRSVRIQLLIGKYWTTFQLDASSSVSLMTEETWHMIGHPTLRACSMRSKYLEQHSIRLKGQATVNVTFHHRRYQLNVFVSEEATMNVVGDDGISLLHLDASSLNGTGSKVSVAKRATEHQLSKTNQTCHELNPMNDRTHDGSRGNGRNHGIPFYCFY